MLPDALAAHSIQHLDNRTLDLNQQHLSILACPVCHADLALRDATYDGERIKSGLLFDVQGHSFPIVDFIPRFVSPDNYVSNFSSQWDSWPEILSSYDGYKTRFSKETKWGEKLDGRLMLEAGCGAGTFTPFAAATGATVLSFDLSTGVEANYSRSGHLDNVLIVQADIFSIPTKQHTFDDVFCFGVLQHTPNPKQAFMSLCSQVKAGGRLAADIYTMPPAGHPYEMLWRNKYRVRKLVSSLSDNAILLAVRAYVKLMWPIVGLLASMNSSRGTALNRYFLFDDYGPRLPGMDRKNYKSFAMLDIYDFLGPKYDIPASLSEFKEWFSEAEFMDIDVHPGYNGLEGRGTCTLESIGILDKFHPQNTNNKGNV